MAELDPSELDLAAAFRAYLEDAPTEVRPTVLAHRFAVAYPHRRGLIDRSVFGLAPAMAWLLLLVGLLLALVVGGLVAGALRQDRAVVPSVTLAPTGLEVLPPVRPDTREWWRSPVTSSGPSATRSVWHFRDGGWTTEKIDATRLVGPDEALTLAPDGTLWVAGSRGVAYRRDGRWVMADAHAAGVITVDRDGTVWVAGTGSSCDIRTLRSNGAGWTRTAVPCPAGFAAGGMVTSMAVDGRGTLWVGAQGFVHDALASYDGGRWETTDARAGLPTVTSVEVLGISATGDVWIAYLRADGVWARARFDGTVWRVPGASEIKTLALAAVAPDGASWRAALARYAGLGWAYAYPGVTLPLTPLAVSPDGTVFAVGGDGSIIRLLAP